MKDNVVDFPGTEITATGEGLAVDFSDVSPEVMNKVFDVMNLLSNTDEILEKFTPSVEKFLANEEMFQNTVYKKSFDDAFIDHVLGLIKDELVEHFHFTPEEISILAEKDFIDLLTDGVYFDKDNYNIKE